MKVKFWPNFDWIRQAFGAANFIIPKGRSYNPENLRSEADGLNESHFSVKL